MGSLSLKGYIILLDDDILPLIRQYAWRPNNRDIQKGKYYMSTYIKDVTGNKTYTLLHRYVVGCTKGNGIIVDHINGDTLDNRRCNLRKTDALGNACNARIRKDNSSGYKGVSLFSPNRYGAYIQYKGIHMSIGYSHDPIKCARMYDMLALKLHGEFACTNFPREDYSVEEIENAYAEAISDVYANNSSGYRGVASSYNNTWRMCLTVKGAHYRKDAFPTAEDAARAYDKMARELLGDKAKLNFPEEG